MGIGDKFDRYVFCEQDDDKLNALKERTRRLAPIVDVTYIPGDVNAKIKKVFSAIPKGKVLSFCFALGIRDKFNKYIFCDKNEEKLSALKVRVEQLWPGVDVTYILGDVNTNTETILSAIPTGKALTFCFADPYKVRNLHFSSIRELSIRFVDFLILIPYMDPSRALSHYQDEENTILDDFLGSAEWRQQWPDVESRGVKFPIFVANHFGNQMKQLEYLYTGLQDMKLVRSTEKHLALYYLAFFSRNELGAKFWKDAIKYSSDQLKLF